MKHLAILSLFTLHSSLFTLSAAVPLKWTVETSRATPAQFEAYQGETLALEASLTSYGKPIEAPSNYSLFWQTNGMGSTYWEKKVVVGSRTGEVVVGSRSRTEELKNSTVGLGLPTTTNPGLGLPTTTNVMFATWSPTNDVGAKVYNCFIGQPGTIYHAAFQLRLRPSPGATPNELPLPQKVIDFAKVTVLNPPWGAGGVDTNAVRDIVRATVDGAARPLPKYLHERSFDDSYPEAAEEYYRSRGNGKTEGGCSSVREGGFLSRNFDYPFDDRAEFVVRMSAGTVPSASSPTGAGTSHRFASVGVAQVGTNLTEQIVTSGKPSRWYKALPGATVDGINENGVACNINVVDGDPQTSGWQTTGDLHPLAAIRWALDNGTSAGMVASNLAARIAFPQGWTQNFHYMIADEAETYIVENGEAFHRPPVAPRSVITNFGLYPSASFGAGIERYSLLYYDGANITNAWFTRAYSPDTSWRSDFDGSETLMATSKVLWAQKPKEAHRGERLHSTTTTSDYDYTWWQTVHTSIYNLNDLTLKIAVQETDDWYVFALPSGGKVKSVNGKTGDVMLGASDVGAYEKVKNIEFVDAAGAGEVVLGASFSPNNTSYAFHGIYHITGSGNSSWMSFADDGRDGYITTDDVLDATNALLSARIDAKRDKTDLAYGEKTWDYSPITNRHAELTGILTTRVRPATGGGYRLFILRLPDASIPVAVGSELYATEEDAAAADMMTIAMGDPEDIEGLTIRRAADRLALVSQLPAPYVPSATDPVFSNAVLGVGIDTNVLAAVAASTNEVAQIGEFYAAFSDIGLTPTQGGMTLAGLLAALVAAVTWLKKTLGKVADNSGEPTDQFATDLLGKPVAKEAIDNRTKASASAITGDALTLPDGGVVSASSSAPTITFGTARQDGLRFCELYITNPDTAADGAIVSISGKIYSDISLAELPKLEKGATYYFTFAEFKVTQETVEGETVSVSHWKVSKQKLDATGGDIPTPTAA